MVLMFEVPNVDGVYVTEHAPLPSSVQDALLNCAVTPLLLLQVSDPVGALVPPVTVARHVVGASIPSGFGVQTTLVVVPSTAATFALPLLTSCAVASPPYAAVTTCGPSTPGV